VRKALAVLAVATCAPALTGCPANPCMGASVVVDDTDGGQIVGNSDLAWWQSGPLDGPWIQYNGGETVTFKYPSNFRANGLPFCWVSTAAYQEAGAGTFTPATGQLCEETSFAEASVSITNQTCANYYLWATVMGQLVTDGGVDASPDTADASRSDATKD
jgi:hypothetical protein